MQIFGICHIANFWNFQNWVFFNFQNYKFLEISQLNFFEFAKLQIFEICQIENFWNCPNFFNSKNQSLPPKIGNFGIVRPFDIPHYSQLRQFWNLLFDIHQFRRFSFSTFISYSSGNFLDWQLHKIINFLRLLNFEN